MQDTWGMAYMPYQHDVWGSALPIEDTLRDGMSSEPWTSVWCDAAPPTPSNEMTSEAPVCNNMAGTELQVPPPQHTVRDPLEHPETPLLSRNPKGGGQFEDNVKRRSTKRTGEKPFSCTGCPKTFATKQQLTSHFRTHSGEKPYQCTFCDRKFAYRINMRTHVRTHTGEKPHVCSICGHKFANAANYGKHVKSHSHKKTFECTLCKKKFVTTASLQKHQKIHSGEKPFECDICDRKYTFKAGLRKHRTTHTGKEPFECLPCNKKFATKRSLKEHLQAHTDETHAPLQKFLSQNHTGEEPLECIPCNKKFGTIRSLKEHLQAHTDESHAPLQKYLEVEKVREKTIECEVCSKKWASIRDMKIHMRSHTREKPFACNLCDKSFSRKGKLTEHHLKFHTTGKKFKCRECPQEFSSPWEWRDHFLTHTGETASNENNLGDNLPTHSGVEPYECATCNRKFWLKSSLREHSITHEEDRAVPTENNLGVTTKNDREKRSQPAYVCSDNVPTVQSLNAVANNCTGEKSSERVGVRRNTVAPELYSDIVTNNGTGECPLKPADVAPINCFGEKSPKKLKRCGGIVATEHNSDIGRNICTAKHPLDSACVCIENVASGRIFAAVPNNCLGEKPCSAVRCDNLAPKGNVDSAATSCTGKKALACDNIGGAVLPTGWKLVAHEDMPEKCAVCVQLFTALQNHLQIHTHLRTHTVERPFECTLCPKKYTEPANFYRHLRTNHSGEKPFKCSICNMKFFKKAALRKHSLTHTENNTAPIEKTINICSKQSTEEKPSEPTDSCPKASFAMGPTEVAEEIKPRNCKGKQPFRCHTCNEKFPTKLSLGKHLQKEHVGERNVFKGSEAHKFPIEKRFKCDTCNKKFARSSVLQSHVRVHTREKPHECNVCNKKFAAKTSLVMHLRVHTGEKPYKCTVCNKAFAQKISMRVHLRTHTGEKPYACPFCEKKFTLNANLRTHLRTHTGETSPYECPECFKKLADKGGLRLHLLRIHSINKKESEIPPFSSKSIAAGVVTLNM